MSVGVNSLLHKQPITASDSTGIALKQSLASRPLWRKRHFTFADIISVKKPEMDYENSEALK